MTVRLGWLVTAMVLAGCSASSQVSTGDLVFGQVYGTVGFLDSKPSRTMSEAPNVVLVFAAADGHRNLVLTQQTGDYLALLDQGRFCVAAYTRAGKALRLAQGQLRCVDVAINKEVRLDIMLAPGTK